MMAMRNLPTSRILALTLALLPLAVAACGDDAPAGPEVASVEVTPSQETVDFLGSTVQFTARVLDARGNVVPNVAVAWASSDPSVASVDATGRATALAEGAVTIAATTAAGVSDQASLTVSPVDCTTEVDLQPGETQLLPINCAISLPGGDPGDRYRVAILNQAVNGSAGTVSTATLTTARSLVTSRESGWQEAPASGDPEATAAVGGPGPIRLGPASRRQLRWAENLRRGTWNRHARIRLEEAELARSLGRRGIRPLPSPAGDLIPGEMAQSQDLPDRLPLRINQGAAGECSEITTPLATAILLGQNDVMAVYQDSVQNADPDQAITPSQAQAILDYYAAYGQATVDDYFPGMPDIDGNGKIILYASFTEPLEGAATAAYVWGGDLYPAENCVSSNEREITYFNNELIRALEAERPFLQALEASVHEAKHIVSFWHGIGRGFDFQPLWLEEGTAEVAGNMSSRRGWAAVGGPAPNARLTAQDFRDTGFDGEDLRPEAFGVVVRMQRAQGYLSSQPNGLVVTPTGAGDRHSIYGTGWTFLRWLGDRYGQAGTAPYADADLFATQVDSLTASGPAGLEAITGKTFQELLEEFTAGVMLHASPAAPAGTAYTSYDFVDIIEAFCFGADNPPCDGVSPGPAGSWPWPVTTAADGTMDGGWDDGRFSGPVGATGVRVHEFVSDGVGVDLNLAVTAEQPAKIVVARIN